MLLLRTSRRQTVRPAPSPRERERRVFAVAVIAGMLGVLVSVWAAVLATGGLGL